MYTQPSATRKLGDFVAGLTFDALPDKVVHEAKREILDIIGCAFGGYLSEIGRITIDLVRELGGKPEATVIGSGDKTSCVNAAYANSRMGNALDFDDVFHGHFAQSAVAASLALCERGGSSGKDLITSVVAGFEVAGRFQLASGPTHVVEGNKQRHSRSQGTGTGMVIAGAAAAAKALGLDRERAYHTLGIAGANIPIPMIRKHAENPGIMPLFKYADAGWCCQAGVTAALLAQKGSTGLPDIFEGDNGALVALGIPFEKCDFGVMVAQLGEKWYLPETSYKPWPSCRLTHSPLTAFTRIIEDNALKCEEIEKVLIKGREMATSTRFRNQEPVGMVSSQFNHPHAIAMVALGIKRPMWHSPSVANDPRVREFRRKVVVELESEPPKIGAELFPPPSVEVIARGQTFRGRAVRDKGDPGDKETYFTDGELKEKFRELALPIHPGSQSWEDRTKEAIEVVFNLEKVEDLGELTRMLSPFLPAN